VDDVAYFYWSVLEECVKWYDPSISLILKRKHTTHKCYT